MNEQFLQELGLTKAQAVAYSTLVKNNPSSPPALAKLILESRTNTYKVLESLESLNLVRRDETKKKISYWANNPSALSEITKKKQLEAETNAKRLKAGMPEMIDEFLRHSEQPGVRYFQGKDGLKHIYNDQLETGQEVTYVRAISDVQGLDDHALHMIRNLFPARGIKRRAITQDYQLTTLAAGERMPIEESDGLMMLERTWIHKDDYTAPVEWSAYGDKLSIISFGEETIGMIIESPQIAEAFRQLFGLLDRGIRLRPDYVKMPQNVSYTAIPESAKKA